jgi:glycosyltransferase involved in cell wall biosynthesis
VTTAVGAGADSVVPQRATIIASTTAEFDSRTHRLATTLAERGHDVTILARAGNRLPLDTTSHDVRIRRVEVSAADALPLPGPVRRRLRDPTGRRAERLGGWSPRLVSRVARAARVALAARAQARAMAAIAPDADVVHAMAFLSLPTALAVSRRRGGPPVVYDARDIYADAANVARLPAIVRRAFARSERRSARRACRVVTVNDAYADVLESRLGPPRPLVVMNCATAVELPEERGRLIHDALGLDLTRRVVLYHGGLSRDRGIEQLVAALDDLPGDVVVVLLGYGELRAAMEAKAADPVLRGRLRVLDAVPPSALLATVASADVAAMPIQPTTLNHRLTTPNKLWEAMAAGVPVVASDLPGMSAIVEETACGVLCDPTSPAAIAAAIRTVLDAPDEVRAAYGRRGRRAVKDRYNWGAQVATLLGEYGRLTGQPW